MKKKKIMAFFILAIFSCYFLLVVWRIRDHLWFRIKVKEHDFISIFWIWRMEEKIAQSFVSQWIVLAKFYRGSFVCIFNKVYIISTNFSVTWPWKQEKFLSKTFLMTLSKKKTKTAFLKRVSWSLALIVWNIPLPLREAFKQHRTSKKSSENSDVVKVSRENHEVFFSLRRSFCYLIGADQDSLFSRLKEKKK